MAGDYAVERPWDMRTAGEVIAGIIRIAG